jgi:hypothetical protein
MRRKAFVSGIYRAPSMARNPAGRVFARAVKAPSALSDQSPARGSMSVSPASRAENNNNINVLIDR